MLTSNKLKKVKLLEVQDKNRLLINISAFFSVKMMLSYQTLLLDLSGKFLCY